MLGDELDIYDDLDDFQEAEEKKSKELQAWESKYESAQVEIASLQGHNKALEKKVKIMEVNFQNLLDTAKAEIKRKDALITQLRKEKDDICFRRKNPHGPPDAKPTFKATNHDAKRSLLETTVKPKNTITCAVKSKSESGHRNVKEDKDKCPKSRESSGQESNINKISSTQSREEAKAHRDGCRERMPDRQGLENDLKQGKDQDHVHSLEKGGRHMKDKDQVSRRTRDHENNDGDLGRDRNKSRRDHEANSRKPEEHIVSSDRKNREHYHHKEHNKKCERNEGQKREHIRGRSRSRSRSRHHSSLTRSRSGNREVNSSQREYPKTRDLKRNIGSRSRSPLNKKMNNSTSKRCKSPLDERPAEHSKLMDVDAPLALMKTENELTIEKAVSTCDQKTMETGTENHANLQTFEHIPGLDFIVGKEIMELEARNTKDPENVFNETVLKQTDQIPELELNEVEKTHHDLKDSEKISDKTELCLSVDAVGGIQANLAGRDNSLKIKETDKINLESTLEQQMINDEIVAQKDNIVPNEINKEDKTIEHMNAEDAKMKEVIVDADYQRSEDESIKSENNALKDLESINNDNCATLPTTPSIQKATDSFHNTVGQERCRTRDPENNYREQSRKGEKKYQEFTEDHATSRKAEENKKSEEQKERDHCQNKNHDVKCERNGKREDHERNRSLGKSRSRHHSRREDNTIQRANPKTCDLKKMKSSRLRSPIDTKCDNYSSKRYKSLNSEITSDAPHDSKLKQCCIKTGTTGHCNSADTSKVFTKTENKTISKEPASTCDKNTIGIEVAKNENCQTFEQIPGLDLIAENEVMEIEAGNTHVANKGFVKTSEPCSTNMQHVLKQTDQISGLDSIEVEKTTLPDLKYFNNDVTGTQEIANHFPNLELFEKVKAEAKVTQKENFQKTTEREEIDMRSVAELVDEEISDDSAVSNENDNQNTKKDHISGEKTYTVKPSNSEGKLHKVIVSPDIKRVATVDICKTKAIESIAEIKEMIAGDAEIIDTEDSVKLPQIPSTQNSLDFSQNKDLLEDDIPTPKRPSTPPGKEETSFFQNRGAFSEVDTLIAKRPVRSSIDIQIIEDIRLPIMMDIENIAASVDKLGEKHEEDELVQPNETVVRKKAGGDIENRMVDAESTVQSDFSKNAIVTTTLTPKPLPLQKNVLYAQPDSTRIDHNDDEIKVDADIEIVTTPEKLIAENLNSSYLNSNLQSDNIEMTLEQLDQYSQRDIQPFEDTVTSTSMKSPKDLIKILMQSPVQKSATVIGSNSKTSFNKVGARSVRERQKSITVTPERLENTPKKIKMSPSHSPANKPIVPQTPPNTPKSGNCSASEDITINETLDASALVEHSNSENSESSIVTKRCSLGNSDYQFEKVNDQIVLRVTRRGCRRVAPAPSVKQK